MTQDPTPPETEDVDTDDRPGPEAEPDTESDPGLENSSTDWASEGGATDEGPATDSDDH